MNSYLIVGSSDYIDNVVFNEEEYLNVLNANIAVGDTYEDVVDEAQELSYEFIKEFYDDELYFMDETDAECFISDRIHYYIYELPSGAQDAHWHTILDEHGWKYIVDSYECILRQNYTSGI